MEICALSKTQTQRVGPKPCLFQGFASMKRLQYPYRHSYCIEGNSYLSKTHALCEDSHIGMFFAAPLRTIRSLQDTSTSWACPITVFFQFLGNIFWVLLRDGGRDIADLYLCSFIEGEGCSSQPGQVFWRIFHLFVFHQKR